MNALCICIPQHNKVHVRIYWYVIYTLYSCQGVYTHNQIVWVSASVYVCVRLTFDVIFFLILLNDFQFSVLCLLQLVLCENNHTHTLRETTTITCLYISHFTRLILIHSINKNPDRNL